MRTKMTPDEAKAVSRLKYAARTWPDSLLLFSWSGTLVVVPADWDRDSPMEPQILATIQGIPNDGGDPS